MSAAVPNRATAAGCGQCTRNQGYRHRCGAAGVSIRGITECDRAGSFHRKADRARNETREGIGAAFIIRKRRRGGAICQCAATCE